MEALMERLKPLDAGMVMRRCQASVAEEEEGGLGVRMHGAATDPEWENKRTMEDGGGGGGGLTDKGKSAKRFVMSAGSGGERGWRHEAESDALAAVG